MEDVKAKVIEVVKFVSQNEEDLCSDELDQRIEDLQGRYIDSLDYVEIVMILEEHFDLDIYDHDFDHIQTINELSDYIVEKLGGNKEL